MKEKILIVIGARPQFIKHAVVELELRKEFELISVHTGQHYDENMSDVFFKELQIRKPDFLLEMGGYNHGMQTGKMMMELEEIVLIQKPDAFIVYGDTNSTLAGALVASKLHIPIFHVEAGLRSYNKSMPEEVNRVLTDHVSDMLFISSEVGRRNLKKEGINNEIYEVGDVMFDMIKITEKYNLINYSDSKQDYYYVTLHRPYNVDEEIRLKAILKELNSLGAKVIFSVHPRTRSKFKNFGLNEKDYKNIDLIDPVSYFVNINYIYNSKCLITDSGGMQKEAYWLKKKCITIRTETEWIETLENGWNILMFDDLSQLQKNLDKVPGKYIEGIYGSGDASQKIKKHIIDYFKNKHK